MKIETLQLDAESAKFFRTVLSQTNLILNSADPSALKEPFLAIYNKMKSEFNSLLEGLPLTDSAPAALDINRHLQCLYSVLTGANSYITYLTDNATAMRQQHASALNSAVEAAIAERIKTGDLIPKAELPAKIDGEIVTRTQAGALVSKETHAQLCSVARTSGLEEGKKQALDQIKGEREQEQKIVTRKESLQTASLPVPGTDVLNIIRVEFGGTEEQFTALKERAQKRIDAFKSKGVAYNSALPVFDKVYLPEDQFKVFETLFLEAAKSETADPFAGGPASPTGSPMLL